MGIQNIQILKHPDMAQTNLQIRRMTEATMGRLVIEHRKGKHTYGNMRRDCPLCNR